MEWRLVMVNFALCIIYPLIILGALVGFRIGKREGNRRRGVLMAIAGGVFVSALLALLSLILFRELWWQIFIIPYFGQ